MNHRQKISGSVEHTEWLCPVCKIWFVPRRPSFAIEISLWAPGSVTRQGTVLIHRECFEQVSPKEYIPLGEEKW